VAGSQITKAPFKISRCDQIILVEGQTIINFTDYTERKNAFFVIGIYIANMFTNKNTDNLIDSILLAHLSSSPDLIKGTNNCLDLDDKQHKKRIAMCLPEENISDIKTVFMEFFKCRMGFIGDTFYEPPCNITRRAKLFTNTTGEDDTPTTSIVNLYMNF
jgi:hypothetical protein